MINNFCMLSKTLTQSKQIETEKKKIMASQEFSQKEENLMESLIEDTNKANDPYAYLSKNDDQPLSERSFSELQKNSLIANSDISVSNRVNQKANLTNRVL